MNNINERPAIEIITEDGHYKIWADGRVTGFDPKYACLVVNRIPVIIAQSIEEDRLTRE